MPKVLDKVKSKAKKVYADFWLDEDVGRPDDDLGFDFDSTNKVQGGTFDPKLIRMASARKAISNFVSILTNRDIPVMFQEEGGISATDGELVVISASITEKKDFDWSVGLALHEGAHICMTDMNLFKTLWTDVPRDILDEAEKKKIPRDPIANFCKFIFNYVEDRFIDTYIFDTSPGYRGYYESLYEKFFHCEEISDGLKSKAWREPTLASYEFRIVNLTNPDTDLNALPGLKEMAEMIGIKNIRRLQTTKERRDLAFDIVRKVLANVGKDPLKQPKNQGGKGGQGKDKSGEGGKGASGTIKKIVDIFFDDKAKPGKGGGNSDSDEVVAVIGGDEDGADKPDINDKNDNVNNIGDTYEFTDKALKKLLRAIEKQRDFLLGRIDKKAISKEQKQLLDTIEKSGIHIVVVQNELIGNGVPEVKCVVVKKLTRELIEQAGVPMSHYYKENRGTGIRPYREMEEVVAKGIQLGNMLGRKLAIRREENVTRYPRRRAGKIERRMIAGIGAGLEDIFYNIKTDSYNNAKLHISVDASSSMQSMTKWGPTMTCVVAICRAASMIPNLAVSVDFRSSSSASGYEAPFIVLAYDSEVDKFEKVRQLFPFLYPHGCTPEGLAMEAVVNSFLNKKLDNSDCYFLNLSDGEPYFSYSDGTSSVHYSGPVAVNHTRQIMNKLRNRGTRILSYFITDGGDYRRSDFHTMYGRDAKFINVTSVFDIARTINEMFLEK